jgi:hypothetical protein
MIEKTGIHFCGIRAKIARIQLPGDGQGPGSRNWGLMHLSKENDHFCRHMAVTIHYIF